MAVTMILSVNAGKQEDLDLERPQRAHSLLFNSRASIMMMQTQTTPIKGGWLWNMSAGITRSLATDREYPHPEACICNA